MENLVASLQPLGDLIVGYYKGQDNADSFDFSLYGIDVEKRVQEHYTELKSLDDGTVDISSLYNIIVQSESEQDLDIEGPPDDEDSYVNLTETADTVEYTFENDERLFERDGSTYIYARDIEYRNGQNDLVPFNGKYLIVTKDMVPKTYQEIIKETDSIYSYVTYKYNKTSNGRDYFSLLYKSLKSETAKVINMYIEDGKVVDFEIK